MTAGHRERLADAGHADVAARRSCRSAAAAGAAELQALQRAWPPGSAPRPRRSRRSTARPAGPRPSRSRLAAAREAAARRADEAGARAEPAADRLRGELDGAPDLDTALAAAAAPRGGLRRGARRRRGRRRAPSAEAVRAAAAAAAAAEAAGFADVAAARAAVRTPRVARRRRSARLRAGDDERAAVEAALADPELHDLPAEPADVGGRRGGRCARPTSASREAGGVEAAAAERLRAARAARARSWSQAQAALVPLEQAAAQVRRLADLCSGGGANALRMTLTSFVLAARLEEVAAVASQRLLRMTQGRYSLVHTDGAVKGGARSGLGLLARDSWTGQDRETSTLSGGETFLASLALALGLADVVQAEAGGTRIEALFVDEGFGTLDEDTLDEVMDVLDGLREGGRVVGLVSHVAELRARIPAQVHVRKTRRGSDVVLLGC